MTRVPSSADSEMATSEGSLHPEFVRHASVEAIQAEIDLSIRVIERESERLVALQQLRAERLQQLTDKTWPWAANSQERSS